jgi:hypothetical protein
MAKRTPIGCQVFLPIATSQRKLECLVLQELVLWLGLPEPSESEWEVILSKRANRGHAHHSKVQGCSKKRQALLPKTKVALQSFFEPWNAMLEVQLGPGFTWHYNTA